MPDAAPTLPVARYLDELRTATAGFAEVLAAGPPGAPVPACPGWDLTDLGRHLEGIHRWARTAVLEARADDDLVERTDLTGPDLVDAYRATAAALVGTLADTAPEAPCWTFGPPRTTAFWQRRQVFETAVHVGDAREAVGAGREPLAADLAADGLAEVVDMMFPRQVRLGRIAPVAAPVALVPSDLPGAAWLLRGDGTGAAVVAGAGAGAGAGTGAGVEAGAGPGAGAQDGAGTVRGTASDLLFLVWRRLSWRDAAAVGRIEVTGDEAAVAAALETRLTP